MGHAFFRSLARAQITGQTVGMLKILFHRETLRDPRHPLLRRPGVRDHPHRPGDHGAAGRANTLKYFINTTFNYPTMAEAYRVAALNGLNRLF